MTLEDPENKQQQTNGEHNNQKQTEQTNTKTYRKHSEKHSMFAVYSCQNPI